MPSSGGAKQQGRGWRQAAVTALALEQDVFLDDVRADDAVAAQHGLGVPERHEHVVPAGVRRLLNVCRRWVSVGVSVGVPNPYQR